MASLKVGLAGLGEWARRAYVPILAELEAAGEIEVAAVSARSEATRQVARELLGEGVRLYGDYGELLGDAELEAVFLALPNALHAEAVAAAVGSGKHVFFEPPIGVDREQVERG